MVEDPVTEDDINELKGDVSALRYELLDVFEKNGMDVSFTDRKEKSELSALVFFFYTKEITKKLCRIIVKSSYFLDICDNQV